MTTQVGALLVAIRGITIGDSQIVVTPRLKVFRKLHENPSGSSPGGYQGHYYRGFRGFLTPNDRPMMHSSYMPCYRLKDSPLVVILVVIQLSG